MCPAEDVANALTAEFPIIENISATAKKASCGFPETIHVSLSVVSFLFFALQQVNVCYQNEQRKSNRILRRFSGKKSLREGSMSIAGVEQE